MSLRWHLVRRTLFTVFAVYLVLTLAFGFVALTGDPNEGLIEWQTATTQGTEEAQQAIATYRAERHLDDPLGERYVGWLVDMTTLDWGTSFNQGEPVMTLIARALPRTLLYVLPAMAFALVGGIGIGLYSATNQGTVFARLGAGVAYVGLGVPNFWLAGLLLFVFTVPLGQYGEATVPGWPFLKGVVLPGLVLGTSLLAGQARYARAESAEYVNAEFVKLLRAKGASGWTIGRHLLRNAAVPLLSLFFADLLVIVALNIYVLEVVFGIPGLGQLSYGAIQDRDLPLILGTVMVLVIAGILGNLAQDVAYRVLDPRIETGDDS